MVSYNRKAHLERAIQADPTHGDSLDLQIKLTLETGQYPEAAHLLSKRIQVGLANVSLRDALRILATVSGTFWRAITPNTIFVAADTRAKRQQLEDQAVQAFYLSNVSQQKG